MSDLTPEQLRKIKEILAPLTRAMIVAGGVIAPNEDETLALLSQARAVIFQRRRENR